MISEHSAHLTPLSVDFRTWLWRYICLLLLISMLWHRQAIFRSKGDKLCSSAEWRIRTRGPRHQIASRLNARWQTDWAIEDQAKNLNSTTRPYDLMHSHENVRNPQTWTASLCQKATNISKINRPWRKSKHQHTKFQALAPSVIQKIPENPTVDPFHQFFGLCDLKIWHMTLKMWAPQAVGNSNHLITYHGNRWWDVLAKAGTDGRTDRGLYGYACRS